MNPNVEKPTGPRMMVDVEDGVVDNSRSNDVLDASAFHVARQTDAFQPYMCG